MIELLALAIALAALAVSLFVLYQLRHLTVELTEPVEVELVYEILPKEESQEEPEDRTQVPIPETAETSAWKNRTGLPFTDYGPPPPPIPRQIPPPLSRPDGFV